jgi:hypothetical protein
MLKRMFDGQLGGLDVLNEPVMAPPRFGDYRIRLVRKKTDLQQQC